MLPTPHCGVGGAAVARRRARHVGRRGARAAPGAVAGRRRVRVGAYRRKGGGRVERPAMASQSCGSRCVLGGALQKSGMP
eukprot:360870-Chlamydomonas_euryale.AAC.26